MVYLAVIGAGVRLDWDTAPVDMWRAGRACPPGICVASRSLLACGCPGAGSCRASGHAVLQPDTPWPSPTPSLKGLHRESHAQPHAPWHSPNPIPAPCERHPPAHPPRWPRPPCRAPPVKHLCRKLLPGAGSRHTAAPGTAAWAPPSPAPGPRLRAKQGVVAAGFEGERGVQLLVARRRGCQEVLAASLPSVAGGRSGTGHDAEGCVCMCAGVRWVVYWGGPQQP